MDHEHLTRLKLTVAAILRENRDPLGLDELAQDAAEALGQDHLPAPLVLFVLRANPTMFVADGGDRWQLANADAPEVHESAAVTAEPHPDHAALDELLDAWQTQPTRASAQDESADVGSGPSRPLTPYQAFEHVKESVVEYLEAAYKIAHPEVVAERAEMLRRKGVVAQEPFIEATPAFPTARKLQQLEQAVPEAVPAGMHELVQFGVPVDRFALYTHQEEALLHSAGARPNLLVATGTGSGKTESFLFPILADILKEGRNWNAPESIYRRGRYIRESNIWLHGRRHETRPAAIRALVLYPMNALVNDQLSRLRRILAQDGSPEWQRGNLNGNLIHFGMYTSLSKPTGSWEDDWRRERFQRYLVNVELEWESLKESLRKTGGWPRPDGPEMLCRWDIQQAPPDILVTNYSMLEYMLVRPIEASIFEETRRWLAQNPTARLTLVLDEAHTYTGAKGTEVAYLIRRLKERLGLAAGSTQFRAIATSASIPDVPGADNRLLQFTSDLFDEPTNRFSLIRVQKGAEVAPRQPEPQALHAFSAFYDRFVNQEPGPAIEQLARDLDLPAPDLSLDAQVALYDRIKDNRDVAWVRERTARRATPLDVLTDECWLGIGSPAERARATAGVLAAGSFARPTPQPDTPPLLSTRVHAFFRGIPGLWACADADCTARPQQPAAPHPRPVGKLYTAPRVWCECGARVLELFSCRNCGLLYLGGIPDSISGGLWPWSDDLSGERQDLRDFRVFGVEAPTVYAQPTYRSTRTTQVVHEREVWARPVYEAEPTVSADGGITSPFPAKCPRCHKGRQPGEFGQAREVIEPLRTRGSRAFSMVVEDGFRVQPRLVDGGPPNYGRKALLFSDSRQEAAQLAADLRRDHGSDLFRQLLYRSLHGCRECRGSGTVEEQGPYRLGQEAPEMVSKPCPACAGAGRIDSPPPLSYQELRDRAIEMQLERRINPDPINLDNFFARSASGNESWQDDAILAFDLALRRELSEDEFSLEPLGLASWRLVLPAGIGAFENLTEEESQRLLRSVARILATENVLLPSKPQAWWAWPQELVKPYERRTVIPGFPGQNQVSYSLEDTRKKLGRYASALAAGLVREQRIPTQAAAQAWLRKLHWDVWNGLKYFDLLEEAGPKAHNRNEHPRGIRIDSFELAPIGVVVYQCLACGYLMSETLFDVCVRCGQQAHAVEARHLSNFYRRAALTALPSSPFDDPYPLQAIEHTAQIAGAEARDLERWFRNLYRDGENPDDKRIDVLSVTTTMEMGIDIGDLLSVGLRNVPPTVANYQQRAGRAGRRGSSVATVLTFAQPKSHDQYYFARPPEIVSQPPRVPSLYLHNEVIARRHVRALVLQAFFDLQSTSQRSSNLFATWGKVGDALNSRTVAKLEQFLIEQRVALEQRTCSIVTETCRPMVVAWLEALSAEVAAVVAASDPRADLFSELIAAGLLPKYAFPVDVVSLSLPATNGRESVEQEWGNGEIQRDLKIALSEYAPGAEVLRGQFPQTHIYRSAGVYDPFAKQPDYSPTGKIVECRECQSVTLLGVADADPLQCPVCEGLELQVLPYLRPKGFTVDRADPAALNRLYQGGGRERSGVVAPVRLSIGPSAFAVGTRQAPAAPHLYAHVHTGQLFACNKGPNRDYPGYLICPRCGRALDDGAPGTHRYPADVPPHFGFPLGPRAGTTCPNRGPTQNQVILGHPFHSEIILLAVDLAPELDAPITEPSGRALWFSFGQLVANASARVLQIDPDELQVGVRPVRRDPDRILGEVYLYDDVPGGAGYARAIAENLTDILHKALELAETCTNPECQGACYQCLYDYSNQALHPLLDRHLGRALLRYVLFDEAPLLEPAELNRSTEEFSEFAKVDWTLLPARDVGGQHFPLVLKHPALGDEVALWAIHPLQARPAAERQLSILSQFGLRSAVHTTFDLERRPFWVLNHLVPHD